jgi:hypothetical protein
MLSLNIILTFFVIKDQATKKSLLKGRYCNGLYPLPLKSLKLAFGVFKPSVETWHYSLGHPCIPIVERVVSSFNLLVSVIQIKIMCVMLSNRQKSINYHIKNLIVLRSILQNLLTQMSGVMLPNPLVENNVM